MNAEAKIALIIIALISAGLFLIACGLGLTSKLAIVGTGIAITAAAASLLGAIWRSGP